MNKLTTTDYLILLWQDSCFAAINTLKDLLARYKTAKPVSLLALNIDWFTNCNWREQLVNFKQLELYYDYNSREYLESK